MARMRSIKPEMFRSITVTSWPRDVRWTFAGLLTYLDDDGRGFDDVRLLKAEIYPLDDTMTARRIENHLAIICNNGPLCRYEVDGRRYLHVTSWREHQRINRPTRSRVPLCPHHERSKSSVSPHDKPREGSLNAHNPHARPRSMDLGSKGSREQGSGGTRDRDEPAEQRTSEPPPLRCPEHVDVDGDPGPCRACGDARRAREAWDADTVRRDAERRGAEARERAELRAAEIRACQLCDDDGYRGRVLCDHDPAAADRAARGSAAARAVLDRRDSA